MNRRLPPTQPSGQTPDDRHVDQRHGHSDPVRMPGDLVELKRNEEPGHDDGHVFAPSLPEHQPDAFGWKQRAVGQQAGIHDLQPVVIEAGDPRDCAAEVAPIGIDVQSCRPLYERRRGALL